MADYSAITASPVWTTQPATTEAVTWSITHGVAEITTNDTSGEGKSLRLSESGIQAVEISAGKPVRYRSLTASAGLARNGF